MRQDQREAIEKIEDADIRIQIVGESIVYMQDTNRRENYMHTCVLTGWSIPETVNEIIKICNKLKGVKE